MNSKKTRRGIWAAVISEVLYGLSYLFTKNATGQASGLALLGWRFVLAFLVMTAILAVRGCRFHFSWGRIRQLLPLAVCDPILYFLGETYGIAATTASESGAFLACIPVVTLLTSNLLLGERASKHQVIGILTSFVGVLVTVLAVSRSVSFSLRGYLSLTMAVLAYSLYSVLITRVKDYSTEELTWFMLLMGAVTFSILALAESLAHRNLGALLTLPFSNGNFLIACLYQALACSVLAFFLGNYAIRTIGVNRNSSFVGLATVVSILAGVLFLGEAFSPVQWLGAGLILAGVYLANGFGLADQ